MSIISTITGSIGREILSTIFPMTYSSDQDNQTSIQLPSSATIEPSDIASEEIRVLTEELKTTNFILYQSALLQEKQNKILEGINGGLQGSLIDRIKKMFGIGKTPAVSGTAPLGNLGGLPSAGPIKAPDSAAKGAIIGGSLIAGAAGIKKYLTAEKVKTVGKAALTGIKAGYGFLSANGLLLPLSVVSIIAGLAYRTGVERKNNPEKAEEFDKKLNTGGARSSTIQGPEHERQKFGDLPTRNKLSPSDIMKKYNITKNDIKKLDGNKIILNDGRIIDTTKEDTTDKLVDKTEQKSTNNIVPSIDFKADEILFKSTDMEILAKIIEFNGKELNRTAERVSAKIGPMSTAPGDAEDRQKAINEIGSRFRRRNTPTSAQQSGSNKQIQPPTPTASTGTGQEGLHNPISSTSLSGRPGSTSASMGAGKHQGVDMMAPSGSPVYAAKDGKVEKIGSDNFGQPTLTIKHPDGTYSRYLHMKENSYKVGDSVKGGQQVGTSGSANGVDHLHFERWNQKPNGSGVGLIDPRTEFGWDSKNPDGSKKRIQGGEPIKPTENKPKVNTPPSEPSLKEKIEENKPFYNAPTNPFKPKEKAPENTAPVENKTIIDTPVTNKPIEQITPIPTTAKIPFDSGSMFSPTPISISPPTTPTPKTLEPTYEPAPTNNREPITDIKNNESSINKKEQKSKNDYIDTGYSSLDRLNSQAGQIA